MKYEFKAELQCDGCTETAKAIIKHDTISEQRDVYFCEEDRYHDWYKVEASGKKSQYYCAQCFDYLMHNEK